ncbi:hypothetical protein [Flavobacterium sp.]|uniref:hypothetical protein n=1 Tax=Flavobacterium sp. TaxID=239 RepID=UPI00375324D8
MKNPWKILIDEINEEGFNGNYVLKEEQAIIERFNKKINNDLYKIHTQIMPAPFMGDVIKAPIVILMLNPGYTKEEDKVGYYSKYKDWWKNEVQHIQTKYNFPFFALEEEYSKSSPYWVTKLKPLTLISTNEKVAKNICNIQFFPYHTEKYRNIHKNLFMEEGFDNYLPSQKYNFQLVKNAMARNAIIIITRSKKMWLKAIPELANYENSYSTNSYLNTIISEKNLPIAFPKILEKLQ